MVCNVQNKCGSGLLCVRNATDDFEMTKHSQWIDWSEYDFYSFDRSPRKALKFLKYSDLHRMALSDCINNQSIVAVTTYLVREQYCCVAAINLRLVELIINKRQMLVSQPFFATARNNKQTTKDSDLKKKKHITRKLSYSPR